MEALDKNGFVMDDLRAKQLFMMKERLGHHSTDPCKRAAIFLDKWFSSTYNPMPKILILRDATVVGFCWELDVYVADVCFGPKETTYEYLCEGYWIGGEDPITDDDIIPKDLIDYVENAACTLTISAPIPSDEYVINYVTEAPTKHSLLSIAWKARYPLIGLTAFFTALIWLGVTTY